MKTTKQLINTVAMIVILILAGCNPKTVTNPVTGKTWMDRNLGASQVATSSTDEAAFGNLYQWGRAPDGHEIRTSVTTTINATNAVAGGGNLWDGLFILEPDEPFDWLTPSDNTLWQGVNGKNNPCPKGFRLPTQAEWEEERLSWVTSDAAGAFASPLKLTVGNRRDHKNGTVVTVGDGYYWSDLTGEWGASFLYIHPGYAGIRGVGRANGCSVRCIKD